MMYEVPVRDEPRPLDGRHPCCPDCPAVWLQAEAGGEATSPSVHYNPLITPLYVPAITTRWSNAALMLGPRRRRGPNIKAALGQRVVYIVYARNGRPHAPKLLQATSSDQKI